MSLLGSVIVRKNALISGLVLLLVGTFAPESWCLAKDVPLISSFKTADRLTTVLGVCYIVFWPEHGSGDKESYVFSVKKQYDLAYMMIDGELTKLSHIREEKVGNVRYEHWSASQIEVTLSYVEDEKLLSVLNEGLGEYHFKGATLIVKKGQRQQKMKVSGFLGC